MPRPPLRLDVDASAEILNVTANDIHPDAAAGDIGNTLSRGEARHKNQIVDLVFRERHIACDQPAFTCFLENALGIDPRAVVTHLDDDPSAAMLGRKPYRAFLGFARGRTRFRRFDAVIDGVANDMGERIAQTLDDRTVDLGVFADHFKAGFLSSLRRQFPHQPRHALKHGAHLLRTHRHDAVFQLAGMMDHLFKDLNEPVADLLRQGMNHLAKHRLCDNQLADHVDHAIDLFELDPRGRRCGRRPLGWRGARLRCGFGNFSLHIRRQRRAARHRLECRLGGGHDVGGWRQTRPPGCSCPPAYRTVANRTRPRPR